MNDQLMIKGQESKIEADFRVRGFSLLEVLIAVAILFVVSSAIIALSNSLLQGTVAVADRTVVNRLAAEGLEIATKIRDENYLNADASKLWLPQAANHNEYGWYKLSRAVVGEEATWKFTDNAVASGALQLSRALELGERLTEGDLTVSRLICVEAVAAEASAADELRCNVREQGSVNDGSRTWLSVCEDGDLYCRMTEDSLNRLRVGSGKIIPTGNAVKVKAVVVWQDKTAYRFVETATLLTNWRSIVEN